jgi:hypothetical protein
VTRLPPFTLIYDSVVDSGKPGDMEIVKRNAPNIAESIQRLGLNRNLEQAIIRRPFEQISQEPDGHQFAELEPVIAELGRDQDVVTVAMWDLGARPGNLPQVISALNYSQPVFTFFELQGAPVPVGSIARDTRIVDFVRDRYRMEEEDLSKEEEDQIKSNFLSNSFYLGAHAVYERIGVNYLVGLTQSMIAGEDDSQFFWNYFSDSQDHILVVSTYDLRRYSQIAKRPFEVAIFMLTIGQLLTEMNQDVEFHNDNGCLFDFNEERSAFVLCIKELRIDDECLKKIAERYRHPVVAMMEALRTFEPEEKHAPNEASDDDDYWLGELDKLGKG